MNILREWYDEGLQQERARLYREVDPSSVHIMREWLYFKHLGAFCEYRIPITHKTSIWMDEKSIKTNMEDYVWSGDIGIPKGYFES